MWVTADLLAQPLIKTSIHFVIFFLANQLEVECGSRDAYSPHGHKCWPACVHPRRGESLRTWADEDIKSHVAKQTKVDPCRRRSMNPY